MLKTFAKQEKKMQKLKGTAYYTKDGTKKINGFYIHITNQQAREAGLELDDPIEVTVEGDRVIVKKAKK